MDWNFDFVFFSNSFTFGTFDSRDLLGYYLWSRIDQNNAFKVRIASSEMVDRD